MLSRNFNLKRKPLQRKPWEKKEHQDAEDFGGTRVKGSGNKWYNPSDVSAGEFRIDSKTTIHQSYSIKETTWAKIRKEAIQNKQLPLLSIQTSSETGTGIEVVVVDKQDFLAMREELNERRKND